MILPTHRRATLLPPRTHPVFLLLVAIVFALPSLSSSEGIFDIRMYDFRLNRTVSPVVTCCESEETRNMNACKHCQVLIKSCLKEFQYSYTESDADRCSYGKTNATLDYTRIKTEGVNLHIPFTFQWIEKFSIVITVSLQPTTAAPSQGISAPSPSSTTRALATIRYSGTQLKDAMWQDLAYDSKALNVTYGFRVRCALNHFGRYCKKYCRGRDDSNGHYKCDEKTGEKACLTGWSGQYCHKAECPSLCRNETTRSCLTPGVCSCVPGWEGRNCSTCVKHPECVHGDCRERPHKCFCRKNWGGLHCNKYLDVCGRDKPCSNGGTCLNTGPDHFTCSCPRGFSGRYCERREQCSLDCLNGGFCSVSGAGVEECTCRPGYSGPLCQTSACASSPCDEGGTCVGTRDGDMYYCLCSSGMGGKHCLPPSPASSPHTTASQPSYGAAEACEDVTWRPAPDGSCNRCRCHNTSRQCSQLVCPPTPCSPQTPSFGGAVCGGSFCRGVPSTCLAPPCYQRHACASSTDNSHLGSSDDGCGKDKACVVVDATVDTKLLVNGTDEEEVCTKLRRESSILEFSATTQLSLHCRVGGSTLLHPRRRRNTRDRGLVLTVTLRLEGRGDLAAAQGALTSAIREEESLAGGAITVQHLALPSPAPTHQQSRPLYIKIVVGLCITGALMVACGALLLFAWHRRRRHRRRRHTPPIVIRTNNLRSFNNQAYSQSNYKIAANNPPKADADELDADVDSIATDRLKNIKNTNELAEDSPHKTLLKARINKELSVIFSNRLQEETAGLVESTDTA